MDGRVFRGQLVTGNYFQMLGVGPALGRTLLPGDAAVPEREPVIVVSFEAWQTMFAGRPDIIGRTIMIRGSPMEVIGVAREGFRGLREIPLDFWAPVTVASRLQDGPDRRRSRFGSIPAAGLSRRLHACSTPQPLAQARCS